jgi:hypothetical protein
MTVITSKAQMRLSTYWLIVLMIAGTAPVRAADSEAAFKATYAAAEAAEREAGRLRNQWTVTEAALADAKKAADRGNFDQAIASAKEAEALARASVFQAISERDAWKQLEIR